MKKIEHFMLPEHTNRLHTEEAISSVSLTRDVARKINEIVDAYNTLSQMDLTWKQEQEGSIRKAIVYIKDNLINTLHDLTVLLKREGFFEETIRDYTTVLERRLNNLLGSLVEGSTTSDAELIDLRVSERGTTFESAGECVRSQMTTKVNVDGEGEVTPQNLQIIEIINPNFFDLFKAPMHPIDGAFSQEQWKVLDKNTAMLNYGGGAQYSLEIDNTNRDNVFISIEADKDLFWVRMSSSADSTQGSTLLSSGKKFEGVYNISSNHFLVFYAPENTTIKVFINEGSVKTHYKIKEAFIPNHINNLSWEGKSVICLGDSITANTNAWVDGLRSNLGLSKITNAGVGGSTISDNGSGTHFVTRVTDDFANYDCVFVMGGTNDEGQSIEIEIFKGAIVELIGTIQEKAPNATIIFATPIAGRGTTSGANATTFVKNALGLSTVDYANAMKEICQMYAIRCIDLYGECGINPFNRTLYISDTVHPNANGQQKILQVLTNGFNSHKI